MVLGVSQTESANPIVDFDLNFENFTNIIYDTFNETKLLNTSIEFDKKSKGKSTLHCRPVMILPRSKFLPPEFNL